MEPDSPNATGEGPGGWSGYELLLLEKESDKGPPKVEDGVVLEEAGRRAAPRVDGRGERLGCLIDPRHLVTGRLEVVFKGNG